MNRIGLFSLLTVIASLVPPTGITSAIAAEPELVSVKKIWDAGHHNAFTDLIRFQDRFYCVFREADEHVGGDGVIRVLVSDDGDQWTSAAGLTEKGVDLRDPKLSITPDGRLMIVMGGSLYNGTKTLMGRRPRVSFSTNGTEWTVPKVILEEGDWLWRVTWNDGVGYGVSYRTQTKSTDTSADWLIALHSTTDGISYKKVTDLEVPNRPNETTLRFMPDGEMLALVRRENGNRRGWIGTSRPPYKDWKWNETEHRLGGPDFIRLPNGELWAGTRIYPGGAKTVLARMTRDSITPVLTLPSRGDTSYPGFVWHHDLLWMSYYSSHEGKTSIYLAKIKLPAK